MDDQPIIDYTSRDYSGLVNSMLDLAATRLPEWTDRSENDLGRLMVELFAYVGDVVLFYQDRIANESFLETAVERRSIIDLLGLIGYSLSTPSPATGTIAITVENDAPTPVQVDVGARFSTEASPGEAPLEFQYLPASDVPHIEPRDGSGGRLTFELSVIHAARIHREILGQATGRTKAVFKVSQSPVLLPRDGDQQDYVTLEIDEGSGFVLWEKRSSLIGSRSESRHYTVSVDENDLATLHFGDGRNGRIPPAGSTLRFTYLIGGGIAGNIAPYTLVEAKSGINVPAEVGNPQPMSGGADRETVARAKELAPSVYRALNRAVTAEDFASLTMNVNGVERAVAVAPNWNYVDLYVVATGGTAPSAELTANILGYLETRKMLTLLVNVREPVFVQIQIDADIGVAATRYQEDVLFKVRTALLALFEIEKLKFGQSFYLSKVFEAIENTDGVVFAQSVSMTAIRTDTGTPVSISTAATGLVQLEPRQFPQFGAINLTPIGGLT